MDQKSRNLQGELKRALVGAFLRGAVDKRELEIVLRVELSFRGLELDGKPLFIIDRYKSGFFASFKMRPIGSFLVKIIPFRRRDADQAEEAT